MQALYVPLDNFQVKVLQNWVLFKQRCSLQNKQTNNKTKKNKRQQTDHTSVQVSVKDQLTEVRLLLVDSSAAQVKNSG